MAGAALSQYGAEFDAGAALNQRGGWGGAAAPPMMFEEDSTRGALSSVSILQISRGVGGAAGAAAPPP